jgi:hypothetical protein
MDFFEFVEIKFVSIVINVDTTVLLIIEKTT